MKIIVDAMPSTHEDCFFCYHNCEYGWLCKLRRNNYCRDVANCDCLQSIEDYGVKEMVNNNAE